MRSIIAIFGIIFLLTSFAFSQTIHVPADYRSIQEAIDAALDRETVLVAPGTYLENIDFKGKALTVMSSHGAESTVIDGGRSGSVVVFQNGEGSGTQLQGFTITNGDASGGGGIFCELVNGPVIAENLITLNRATNGGGLLCNSSSISIVQNEFLINTGVAIESVFSDCNLLGNIIEDNDGSGVVVVAGHHYMEDNSINANGENGISIYHTVSTEIRSNRISHNAGCGIYMNDAAGPVIGNIISQNRNSGIYGQYSNPKVVNNIIDGNSAEYGGGMFFDNCWYGPPLLWNNTIVRNRASRVGGGLYYATVDASAENCIFWNNQAPSGPSIAIGRNLSDCTFTVDFSDLEGGPSSVAVDSGCSLVWGGDMIEADPAFVDLDGDFHLTHSSPCRDAGSNAAVFEPFDFEGDPRPSGGPADMGADEFHPHLYLIGKPEAGGFTFFKIIGEPGTPVHFGLGSGVMEPPWRTRYGNWYLEFPLRFHGKVGEIPASGGVLEIFFPIPDPIHAPLSLPFQAKIGPSLTNLTALEIK